MSKNFLIPACVAVITITAAIAGYTGFEYQKNVEADRFYIANANALQTAALSTIAISGRAARDTSYIGELTSVSSQVYSNIGKLRAGNPTAGIPPLPEISAANLYGIEESWDKVLRAVSQISNSRATNADFSRQSEESRVQAKQLLDEAAVAIDRIIESPSVDPGVKDSLSESYQALAKGTELVVSGAVVTTDTLRLALDAAKDFIAAVAQAGKLLPRDNALIQPLLSTYRSAQLFQRNAVRTIESASGQVDNAPYAQAIWAERTNLDTALNGLMQSIQALPQSRFINSTVMIIAIAILLLVVSLSVVLILREAKKRTKEAESLGTSIKLSQNERSKALSTLIEEMQRAHDGDLTVDFTVGQATTDEIAVTLNSVFNVFRTLVKDVQLTIVNLSAASEQTLTQANNVSRNREEQERAIEHISKLVDTLVSFIDKTDQLSIQAKDSSQEVNEQIKTGSKAVQDVHEGVMKISQSNMNIMHHTKAMTENIQSLERLVEVVRRVASQSGTVAYNALLVADAISDEVLSRRIRVAGESMQKLTSSANEASEQIATNLRGINDAARDTQHVLDASQAEIKELTTRSDNALSALGTVREQSTQLANSIINVTEQTAQLRSRSDHVNEVMVQILRYNSEHSASSEQTASAIGDLNQQAQRVGETLSQFSV